jgi:hypothetical protein
MTPTTTSGAAIQRYKIGYRADEWGQRSSTPSGILDASGSWVRYADHIAALAAGQATAAQQEAQEPYAYAVYFPDQPKVELVHELDDLIDDLTNRPHVVTKLYTAPRPSPAAQGDAIEHELAMLIRRIVSSARRNCQDESNVLKLANEAWAYLVRKGLVGSPLRDVGIESDVAPQAADSVQEDAAQESQYRRGYRHGYEQRDAEVRGALA